MDDALISGIMARDHGLWFFCAGYRAEKTRRITLSRLREWTRYGRQGEALEWPRLSSSSSPLCKRGTAHRHGDGAEGARGRTRTVLAAPDTTARQTTRTRAQEMENRRRWSAAMDAYIAGDKQALKRFAENGGWTPPKEYR